MSLGAAPAAAVPRHEHNMITPSGKSHAIAGGVTHQAPCNAFLNFHDLVHIGVFVEGSNPHSLTPTFVDGDC